MTQILMPHRHVIRFGTHQVVRDLEIKNHRGKPTLANSEVRVFLPRGVFRQFRKGCRKHGQSIHIRDCLIQVQRSGNWSLIRANEKIRPTALLHHIDTDPTFGAEMVSVASFATVKQVAQSGFQPHPKQVGANKNTFTLPLQSGAILKVAIDQSRHEFPVATINEGGHFVTLWGQPARRLIPSRELKENFRFD